MRIVLRLHALLQTLFVTLGHIGYGTEAMVEYFHFVHHTKFNWNFGNQPYLDIQFETDYKDQEKLLKQKTDLPTW